VAVTVAVPTVDELSEAFEKVTPGAFVVSVTVPPVPASFAKPVPTKSMVPEKP
jgi:hypothetical protein